MSLICVYIYISNNHHSVYQLSGLSWATIKQKLERSISAGETNCPIIAHPVVLAVLSTDTQTHTMWWGARGWVRGWSGVPKRREGKHLVTPLFLTMLLEVQRQQGWKSIGHRWHLLLCGSFSVVASYLTIFNHINNCQKSVYSSIRKTYLPTL